MVDAEGAEESQGRKDHESGDLASEDNDYYGEPRSARPLDLPLTFLTPPIGQRQEPCVAEIEYHIGSDASEGKADLSPPT